MNKTLLLSLSLLLAPTAMFAQSAMDGYAISGSDLKGTARFMSMGGAFGALGGDLTTLSQNPAGIGVYRSSEIGFTVDIDCHSTTASSLGYSEKQDFTKFLLNNIGIVSTWRLNSNAMPNINFGFTYHKAASFNRRYQGRVPQLQNSLSNMIAGISNANSLTVGDVESTDNFDAYNPNDGGYEAPWISILGYDSYLTSPLGSPDSPRWVGQWGEGTSGNGDFTSWEQGGVDEYNISVGGNIANVVYWGMDFGITDLNYISETTWGENLDNAYVENNGVVAPTTANWNMYNFYQLNGSGFNYKLGLIFKPIQELRIGFAFHTPTWYSLDQYFYSDVQYQYGNGLRPGTAKTNNGEDAYNQVKFHTPWRLIFSAAGVIGSKFIISADYEWKPYNGMHFSSNYWGWNSSDPFAYTNADIKTYYKASNTLRLGAEYRITPQFSVRAGYSLVTSGTQKNLNTTIETAGTRPQYVFDDDTNYITCGLGYRIKNFYVDGAYVYKHRNATYHAYTPDPANPSQPSPTAELKESQSQIVISMGFKF